MPWGRNVRGEDGGGVAGARWEDLLANDIIVHLLALVTQTRVCLVDLYKATMTQYGSHARKPKQGEKDEDMCRAARALKNDADKAKSVLLNASSAAGAWFLSG